MTVQTAAPTFLHFSTDDWPERDRAAAWREQFGRKVIGLDFDLSRDVPLQAGVTLHDFGGVHIATGFMSAGRQVRTRELVADGNDDLYLLTFNGSASVTAPRRQEIVVGGNDALLVNAADPYAIASPETLRVRSLRVPRAALAPMAAVIEDAVLRPLPRNMEALRLLIGYADLLMEDHVPVTPEVRRLAATHVHDLLALVIGAGRDATAVAKGRGLRAARLCAIKADIIKNLNRSDLSVTAVAARQRVSPRYIQKLFDGEGTTFSESVLGERLASAHRMLTDPAHVHLTISTIAFDAGFGDLSHFNRAFRRRFGATPSEVRAEIRVAEAMSQSGARG